MRKIVESVSGRCIGSDEKENKVFECVTLYSAVAVSSPQSIAELLGGSDLPRKKRFKIYNIIFEH